MREQEKREKVGGNEKNGKFKRLRLGWRGEEGRDGDS